MPQRAGRPCSYPGCPRIVRGIPYCEEHARLAAKEYDAERPSAAARGYNANWRKLRAMYLRQHPLCEDPFEIHGARPPLAREVDHVMPLADGGTNAWDNLQALCKSCHSRKTAREVWHGDRVTSSSVGRG